MKNCPYCAEEIQDAAVKCRHCLEWLEPKEVASPSIGRLGGGDEISSWDQYLVVFRGLPPSEQKAEWEKLSTRQRERLRRMGLRPPAQAEPKQTMFSQFAGPKNPLNVTPRQILAFAACALLIGGVFAPLVRVAEIGSVSYVSSSSAEAVGMICIALLAFLLARRQYFDWLLLPILLAGGLAAFTYLRLTQSGPIQQLHWGCSVLGLGFILLIVSAAGSETLNQANRPQP